MSARGGAVHETRFQVAFDEVDMYGLVHHSKYFIYMERARVLLLGELGMRGATLAEAGLGLIVIDAEVKFKASGRFMDPITVALRVRKMGAVRLWLDYQILREQTLLVEAALGLAFVDGTGRPARPPGDLAAGLRRYLVI